jgi:hypothetical protein
MDEDEVERMDDGTKVVVRITNNGTIEYRTGEVDGSAENDHDEVLYRVDFGENESDWFDAADVFEID